MPTSNSPFPNNHKDDFNSSITLIPKKPQLRNSKRSQYCNSSFISNLLFLWAIPILSLHPRKGPIKVKNLPQITPIDLSRKFFKEIHQEWNKTTSSSLYPLFKAVYKASSHSIILISILSSIKSLLTVCRVFLFRQTLLSFQPKPNETAIFSISITITLFLLVKLLIIISSRKLIFNTEIQGAKSTIQINALLYDKLLKITTYNKSIFSEGELVNFIQLDSEKFSEFLTNAPTVIIIFFQLGFYIVLLFKYFGCSFLIGMMVQIIIIIVLAFCEKEKDRLQKKLMSLKDERMKKTSQAFSMIKSIKLYSWEDYYYNQIDQRRENELKKMKEIEKIKLIITIAYQSSTTIVSVISITLYTLFYDSMDISNILTAIYIFNSLNEPLGVLPEFITNLSETILSMKRLELFLFSHNYDIGQVYHLDELSDYAIRINHCDFGIKMPLKKDDVVLLKDINIDIKKNELIGVFGEVGSGKTCFLNAIMNNSDLMNKKTLCNIKTQGSISFVSQEPWILNDTLRNNIIFDKEMDEEKYNKIISLCELNSDIMTLNGGDMIEIGEKGINLSGGQKVRISIARALYADSNIYLLDDPLSALDANTGSKIFNNVILGYMKNKTRIVVSHAMQYYHLFDKIIYLKNGMIQWFEKDNDRYEKIVYNTILKQKEYQNAIKLKETNDNRNNNKKKINETNKIDKESIALSLLEGNNLANTEENSLLQINKDIHEEVAKITKEEYQNEGTVNYNIWITYFTYAGGSSYIIYLIIGNVLWKCCEVASDYFLSYWTIQQSLSHEQNMRYLLCFATINILITLCVFIRSFLSVDGVIKYSKKMHEKLLLKLFNAPINLFHDTIPRAQILNRLSKDLDKSNKLFTSFNGVFKILFQLCSCIFICLMFNWTIMLLIPLLFYIDFKLFNYYRQTSLDLNRLEGIVRTPIISVFSETIPGLSIIRAFNYQDVFKNKFFKCLNDLYKVKLYQLGCRNWLATTLHMLSFFVLFIILSFACIFKQRFSPQAIGLLLTYSMKLTDCLYSFISKVLKLEREITSVERCHSFTKIIQEKEYKRDIDLSLENYPNEGKIEFHNYSAKYRPETPFVLQSINIKIYPKEKIGVVGRTGSGKSTLCLALFRIIEGSSGKILIDDINIASIGLKLLRNSITIIPQDPFLIEGTLRDNLDPLNVYTDSVIINVMKEIGLDYLLLFKGLDLIIEENGSNLSVGEKQLICIARAIIRNSKIIVMDEATSSIDYKTESTIQKVIAKSFRDSTVITIAHRIKTVINYDKILVLSKGKLVDFASPQELLNKRKGIFYKLYTQSLNEEAVQK